MLEDVLGNLIQHGLKKIMIINGHGGNVAPIAEVTLRLRQAEGVFIPSLYLWQVAYQLLRQIMGEEPVLMEEKLNGKQPLTKKIDGLPIKEMDDFFPVHNDWAYYAAQNYPQSVLSSALLLDDCTTANGPLRIWPGSHKKHLEHEMVANGLEVRADLIDHQGGIDMLAPAGSFMIFHVLVVHNSRPNTSGKPRRLMIYSHYPESFKMPFDVRNSPTRLREAPWEREYMRAKERGDYQDTFQAPTYL